MHKSAAARRYYTLLERGGDGVWRIEFGDYDRETVAYELDDRRDHGIRAKDLKILTTGAGQAAINAAVDKVNGVA